MSKSIAAADNAPGSTPAARSELHVTPMLDVLLVLLVIFMAVTSGVHHTMDVALPEACRGACESTATPIVLQVLPQSTFRLNGQKIPSAELLGRLRAVYAGRPEKIIQVAGSRDVPYEQVIDAMDVAKSAGVRVIGIVPGSVRDDSPYHHPFLVADA